MICYSKDVMNEQEKAVSQWSLTHNVTNVTLSEKYNCKSIAAMCMADTEVS